MIMKPLQYVLYVDYDYGVYLCNMDFVTRFLEILAAILCVRTVSVISARNILYLPLAMDFMSVPFIYLILVRTH
jgi:hypothetical protein